MSDGGVQTIPEVRTVTFARPPRPTPAGPLPGRMRVTSWQAGPAIPPKTNASPLRRRLVQAEGAGRYLSVHAGDSSAFIVSITAPSFERE